jgi:arabinose-5-phosphate isomerase
MTLCTSLSPFKGDWLRLAQEVFAIEIQGLEAARDALDDDFVRALTCMAECSGRVVISGIGKSGLVGRKIAATLSSTGTPSFFLHPVEGAHGDMGMIRREDVVVVISNSGETDELNAILPSLRSLAGKIIGLTGNRNSTMARFCDAVISTHVPREACPLGLAPTASTTATLAVGDALAVCLIEWKSFEADDFKKYHPGGALGQRLSQPVTGLMHVSDLPVCAQGASLQEALTVLNRGGLGMVVLVDGQNRLVGILTDGDVRRLLCAGIPDMNGPVAGVMTGNPRTGSPEQTAAQVLDMLEQSEVTVLPIVDGDRRLLGMVHLHDLLGKGKVKFSER